MTKKRYYFNELREDNLLYPLSQVVKDILQYNEFVIKMYRRYNGVLYDQLHRESSIQLGDDKPMLFSPGPVASRSTPQYTRISSNSESKSKNKVSKSRPRELAVNEENVLSGKENKAFSLTEGCKALCKCTANELFSGEETKIQASSTQLDQKNFGSSPKRKSTNPKNEYMLFKCMPRYVQSSGFVEIETDVSSKSEECPFLPRVCNCSLTAANDTGEKRPSKNMHFSEDSKTWVSSDLDLQDNLTRSIAAKANRPSSFEVLDHEKEHLSYELLKAASPPSNNLEPNALTYDLKQVFKRLKSTHGYMNKFLGSLLKFRDDLKTINKFLYCIQRVVRFILVNKNCMKYTRELRKNISALKMESSKLQEKIGSCEKSVEEDIQSWVESFEKIQNWVEDFEKIWDLQTANEQTVCYHQPLITFESCHTCEKNLKTLRKKLKDITSNANSRIRLFVSTAKEFAKIVKIFVKCLVHIGILKPSLKSKL